eukprot:m.9099 g.9099  ORF g.9099 m.9099 type:complete len:1308 (-) comp4008_c0_seq1:192-4115(-)
MGVQLEGKEKGQWYEGKVVGGPNMRNNVMCVLVHFIGWNKRQDRWYPADSMQLRPFGSDLRADDDEESVAEEEEEELKLPTEPQLLVTVDDIPKNAPPKQLCQAFRKIQRALFIEGPRAKDYDVFVKLPKKKDFPEYFKTIKKPMDLHTVEKKLEKGTYASSKEYLKDIALLAKNAQTFNMPGSAIHQRAYELLDDVVSCLQESGGGLWPYKQGVAERKKDSEANKPKEDTELAATQLRLKLRTLAHVGVTRPGARLQFKSFIATMDDTGTFMANDVVAFPTSEHMGFLSRHGCSSKDNFKNLKIDGFEMPFWDKALKIQQVHLNTLQSKHSGQRNKGISDDIAMLVPPAQGLAPTLLEGAGGDHLTIRIGRHVYVENIIVTGHPSKCLCFACGTSVTKGHLMTCNTCAEPYHTFCVSNTNRKRGKNSKPLDEWICDMCESCTTCGRGRDLLCCDDCGKLTHAHCLRFPPPLNASRWLCPDCVSCECCGRITPGDLPGCQWQFDYRFCQDCGQKYAQGNYCPMCEVVYNDDDWDLKMLNCDGCKHWVHIACDGLDEETYEKLSVASELEYFCPLCRNKRNESGEKGSLLENLLAQAKSAEFAVLNRELFKAFESVRKLQKAWAFIPDSKGEMPFNSFPEYRTVIKKEDDIAFSEVKRKLNQKIYQKKEDFLSDMKKIFDNCRKYHQQGMYVKSADDTEEALLKKVEKYTSVLEDQGAANDVSAVKSKDNSSNKTPQKRESDEQGVESKEKTTPPVPNTKQPSQSEPQEEKTPSKETPDVQKADAAPAISDEDVKKIVSSCKLYAPNDLKQSDTRTCEFCMQTGDRIEKEGGRLIPLMQPNQWIHVNCALWSAEVYEDVAGAFMSFGSAYRRARHLKCTLCHQMGATVGCVDARCRVNYHFPCAVKDGGNFLHDKSFRCRKHKTNDKNDESLWSVNRQVYVPRDERKQKKEVDVSNFKFQMGGFILHDIGEICTDPGYHKQAYLYPVGFTATRPFWCSSQPKVKQLYTFQILRGTEGPLFVIKSASDTFYAASPDDAWDKVMSAIQSARKTAGLPELKFNCDGVAMFGINIPALVVRLEKLPRAAQCNGYRFRFFEPAERNVWRPRDNPTGCARSEPYSKKILDATLQSGNTSGYELSKSRGPQARAVPGMSSALALTMQYRHAKKVLKETVAVRHSKIHGWGLFAKSAISKDQLIIEYQGELVRVVLCDKRERYYDSRSLGSYMFRIDDEYCVDATLCGSQARFVNHSCEPNCGSKIISVEGVKHIMICALRTIPIGEELTYDYKFPIEENKVPCYCGAKNCRGTMN